MMIPVKPLKSDMIEQVSYDATQRRLRVTFADGAQSDYYNVSPAVYAELMHADLPDPYFTLHIRNQYRSYPVPTRERATSTNPMGAIVRSSLAS